MKKSLLGAAALLALAASPAASPKPDIVPRNSKSVSVTTTLDLGPLSDKVCLQYVIVPGDSLEKIAKLTLGSRRRWEEILDQNPGLDPRRMKVGARIWLPPRDAKATPRRYVYVDAPHSGEILPLTTSLQLQDSRYAAYVVYVVPEAQLATFLKKVKKNRRGGPILHPETDAELHAAIAQLTATVAGRYVGKDSPIAKITCALEIRADAKGRLSIRTATTLLDKDGKKVEAGRAKSKKPKEGDAEEQFLLLLLAGAGGTYLMLRARQPAATPAVA